MAGTVDPERVDRIREFLQERGDQGATMNDLFNKVCMNRGAIQDALNYLKDKGEVYRKGMTWYLKDAS